MSRRTARKPTVVAKADDEMLPRSGFFWQPHAVGGKPSAWGMLATWAAAALAVIAFALVLSWISDRFRYEIEIVDMPCIVLVAMLMLAGGVYALAIPRLAARSLAATRVMQRGLLAFVFFSGLAARILLITSEPILEDDFYRYLWDGAVTASAQNPYTYSPRTIKNGEAPRELVALSVEAGDVFTRINHQSLTTIYPPVAQAVFAIAHVVKPWSLAAWRGLLIFCDVGSFLLLIRLLDLIGRDRTWVAIYWFNPVVLKELFNSAHMEAVLVPFVLGALLLVAKRRPIWATVSLGLAAGIKLWPVILAPVIWRSVASEPGRLAACVALLGGLMALWLAPMLAYGVSETSGLVAYVDQWQTNSAFFPALERGVAAFGAWTGLVLAPSGLIARALVAGVLAALALSLAYRPLVGLEDLLARSSIIVAAVVLLSPAQYPWYTVWMAPFLVFRPYPAFLLLSALIPLYYMRFYLVARDAGDVFSDGVVWAIWGPVLAVLIVRAVSEAFARRPFFSRRDRAELA